MTLREECLQRTDSEHIVFRESGNRIEFINPRREPAQKVKVDGCQIRRGRRCDYLLVLSDEEHFIELKGHDHHRAFEQLRRTISLLGRRVSIRESYVICNRSPMTSPEIQSERLKFKKNHNSGLTVGTKQITVRI